MKYVRTVKKDPDPGDMPERGLICAFAACKDSDFPSDRRFAAECAAELKRRGLTEPLATTPEAAAC